VEAEQVFPELPDELKLHVLSFLAERDMAVFGAVCRQAAAMANDNHVRAPPSHTTFFKYYYN
jgi:hypothetical protein